MKKLMLAMLLLWAPLSAQHLLPSQVNHDLDVLVSAWNTLHPGLYRYISQKSLEEAVLEIREEGKEGMSDTVFYIRLSQLCEKVRCAHTFPNPLNLDQATASRILPSKVIPFFYVVIGQQFIITGSPGNTLLEAGDAVLAINEIPVKTIIDSLLSVSRSDGNKGMGKRLNNLQEMPSEMKNPSLFDIYAPLFFRWEADEWNIRIHKFSLDKIMEVRVKLVTFAEREELYKLQYGKIPSDEYTWEYRQEDSSTAYMKFGTFAFWNSKFDPRSFIDSAFTDLAVRKNVTRLIIDIRENEGGDSKIAKYILAHLKSEGNQAIRPIPRNYRYLEVPDSLKRYLRTWDPGFFKTKDSTRFRKTSDGLWQQMDGLAGGDPILPAEPLFRGKTFLITGPRNSSAGFIMAAIFRDGNYGTIIGEPTGGTLQGINGGEFFFLTLPNSRFEVDLPLVYQGSMSLPDKGIIPDIVLSQTQLSTYKGSDEVLEYLRSLPE